MSSLLEAGSLVLAPALKHHASCRCISWSSGALQFKAQGSSFGLVPHSSCNKLLIWTVTRLVDKLFGLSMSWLKRPRPDTLASHEPSVPGAAHASPQSGPNTKCNTSSLSELNPETLHDGTVLNVFLTRFVSMLLKAKKSPHNSDEAAATSEGVHVHTVAEICSGSCVTHCATTELNRIYKRVGIPHRFELAYICEVADLKRGWGTDVVEIEAETEGVAAEFCTFKDACDLHKGRAPCDRHNKSPAKRKCSKQRGVVRDGKCTVPNTEGVVIGCSCKDLSKGNQNKARIGNPLDKSQSHAHGGSTQATFYALIDLIDSKGNDAPLWVLLENVDELVSSKDQEVIDIVLSEFASRGYEGIFFTCNSTDWGLPQNRKRVFVVAVRVAHQRKLKFGSEQVPVTAVFQELTDTFASARMRCGCLTRALLPNHHPVIMNFEGVWTERDPKGWDSATLETHQKFWNKIGSFLGEKHVTPQTAKSKWYAKLNARDKDSLVWHQNSKKQIVHMFFASDVSQSIGRVPHSLEGHDGVVYSMTVLPGGVIYVSQINEAVFERVIHGAEGLSLGGFPIFAPRFQKLFEKYSSRNMMDLGGNMFAGTIIGALCNGLVFELPWQYDESGSSCPIENEETQNALSLLADLGVLAK